MWVDHNTNKYSKTDKHFCLSEFCNVVLFLFNVRYNRVSLFLYDLSSVGTIPQNYIQSSDVLIQIIETDTFPTQFNNFYM